ncbi:helix-turn-helix domain-containing protein [Coralloluteibacterium thermophilus]|uniref:Helix-turn-helix domain-containing protein n=1 Tax=Coralloluteibacterium thermophilum TaxID=2707049 RepID=A0ABV9NMH3_9GAMM
MSFELLRTCWPLQMPPTAKAVLVSLADQANDYGECWPAIPTICERTCFSRRAVIAALAWLESAGALTADRSNGRKTSYRLTPSSYVQPVQEKHKPAHLPHQCETRTGASAASTSAPPALDQCTSRTKPVHLPHPNHQEPSRTNTKSNPKGAPASAVARPDGVREQVWKDWLTLRKAKKAPVTETVLGQAVKEAQKAGVTLDRFLEIWCARGSQGLQADWLKPNERAGPPLQVVQGRPSIAQQFGSKTYQGTPDDELPDFLRAS